MKGMRSTSITILTEKRYNHGQKRYYLHVMRNSYAIQLVCNNLCISLNVKDMKEVRYTIFSPASGYFVGLFNWGKVYKPAKTKCYLKISAKKAFDLAKSFGCLYVTEWIFNGGKMEPGKTYRVTNK